MKSVIASVFFFGILVAQQPASRPAFEVASVKLTDPSDVPFVGMSEDPSFVSYRNLSMRDAIRGAYKIREFQIVGPDWMLEAPMLFNRRSVLKTALLFTLLVTAATCFAQTAAPALPSEISDKDFWKMIVDLSERIRRISGSCP